MASKNAPDVQQSSVHVQGSRDWQDAWKLLCDFADSHELIEITMDLNAPWLHESFHATRRRSDIARGDNHAWYSQIPIITGGRVFGRIEILVSGTDDESHHGLLRNLLVVTAEVEYSVAESIRESIYTRVDGEKDPAGANGVVEETTVEPGSPVDGAVAKSLPMDADPDVSGSTASAN
jgi:hypothetical protein